VSWYGAAQDMPEQSQQQPVRHPEQTLLLSVDFEDWHQLVRRRVGDPDWRSPGPALARQTEALLTLFDSLGVRCTFFILGMAARAHPGLVRTIADSGHEIGSHGDQHLPVHSQAPEEFEADLRAACATIEELTAAQPAGYRAPAFSITEDAAAWSRRILAEQGFAYDASRLHSFAIGERPSAANAAPHPLAESGMWEFPVAVWQTRWARVPVGGASYWSIAPASIVLRGLERAGPYAGLYLHPHEFDPRPLRPMLGTAAPVGQRAHAWLRGAQRNLARRRAPDVLRAIAEQHPLITYGEAHARLGTGIPARS
jgi:peptidoglycan/xylan/chitin deacetylase (PgdA/CDA1 family)